MKPHEINQAIAKALGYVVESFCVSNPQMHHFFIHKVIDGVMTTPIPLIDWTRDTHAAVGLCDVMRSEGFRVTCISHQHGGWFVEFMGAGMSPDHTAPTLAEAIAGAFLKSLGLWTEE